ncbi:YihY/virulence factor BrkB family protein [Roseomonas sp. F4]
MPGRRVVRQGGNTGVLMAAAVLAGLLAYDAAGRAPAPHHGRAPSAKPPVPSTVGHSADTPSDIPPRGWWEILRRTVSQASEDRLMTEAAGITFYILLALFPALAALVSLYGLVADPATVQQHLSALAGIIPGGGMQIIEEQVQRVAQTAGGSLGLGALAGLAVSLWSASKAAKAVFDALNVVYEEQEKRGFIKLTAITLVFTLGFILFAILTMLGVVAVPVVLGYVGMDGRSEALLSFGRWPALLLLASLVLACLYRWGPSREKARWRWVSWGSAFAALAWLGGSAAFSWYVANFGSYNETYGSLGAVVGFMTWIWISATVVLLGAELNAEMEHQTAKDTTTRPVLPMGLRGARMADTVA